MKTSYIDVGLYGPYMVMNIMEPGPPYEASATHHTAYLHTFDTEEEIKDLIQKLKKLLDEVTV